MTEQSKSILDRFHIFGLAAFAFSLPLFITLAQSQEFFLVYRAGPWVIVAFALIVGIVLPLILQLLIAAIRRLNTKMSSITQTAAIGILAAIALMPNAKKLPYLPGWAVLILCVALGAITARFYLKNTALRGLIGLFSIAALLYPAWFITQSQIVFSPRIEAQGSFTQQPNQPRPPVFLIVFDEFPLVGLLDRDRLIDRELFPNFARLADDANWFRNASTVADMTVEAVPAIFTGNYPLGPNYQIPTFSHHPENIFTILNRHGYDIYAYEEVTRLSPVAINRFETPAPSLMSELKTFATDIFIITGHILLKEDLVEYIPPIEGMVARFSETAVLDVDGNPLPPELGGDRRERPFSALLQVIEPHEDHAYIIHLGVPHQPYRYMKSGNHYMADRDHMLQFSFEGQGGIWVVDPTIRTIATQRFYHQLQYCDTLLGRLLDKLDALNIYNQSLIAVTADHGVSFRPELSMRNPIPDSENAFTSLEQAMDIVKVPAILKLPNQQQPQIRDEPFQTIDLLPTILNALAIDTSTSFDGRPFLSPNHPQLTQYKFFSKYAKRFVVHDLDILDHQYVIEETFMQVERKPGFTIKNSYTHILQEGPIELYVSDQASPIEATLIGQEAYQSVDLSTNFIPAFIRVQIASTPAAKTGIPVLVNVNNQFGAVATTFKDSNDRSWIAALVSESLFQTGLNTIQLYEIAEDQSEAPRLDRIRLE